MEFLHNLGIKHVAMTKKMDTYINLIKISNLNIFKYFLLVSVE